MELFILNDVDYTKNILMPSYKVQRQPVTKEWEDATYKKHKDLLRWRLEGSFTLYFDDVSEFQSFMTNLNNLRLISLDNYIPATLYDNDKMEQVTSYFDIKITLSNNLPYYGTKKHDGYEVEIEEK